MSKQSARSKSNQSAEGNDKLPKVPLLKAKFGNSFGQKDILKGNFGGQNKAVGFDPSRFKTQHKG